jgi:hypothetical protein
VRLSRFGWLVTIYSTYIMPRASLVLHVQWEKSWGQEEAAGKGKDREGGDQQKWGATSSGVIRDYYFCSTAEQAGVGR